VAVVLGLALATAAHAQDEVSGPTDGGATEKVIDRAVAAVDGKVITLSQLDFEARVLLVSAGGTLAAFAPLPPETLARSLEAIIDERLAVYEADKLDAFALEPGELEKIVEGFKERFVPASRFQEFLAAHEATDISVGHVLRRHLRAARVLESKFRLKAQLSEAEARRIAAARDDLKSLPPETARQVLFTERFKALVQKELADAKKTIDVRKLGPFAIHPGAPAE
jgi:hypothetical protein